MRKFLTSLAAISLVGSLFLAAPAPAAAAAGATLWTITPRVGENDIIHKDASRHALGQTQTYVAEKGDVLDLNLYLETVPNNTDLDDTDIFLKLTNASWTGGIYGDAEAPLNGDCVIDWDGVLGGATGATIQPKVDCDTNAAGDDYFVTIKLQITLPASGTSSVLEVSGAGTTGKVYFFGTEASDQIYVSAGTLGTTNPPADGNCADPDFSTDSNAQGSIEEALFAAFAAVDGNDDTIILCNGTYTYGAGFEQYEGTDLWDGEIHLDALNDGNAILDGNDSFQLILASDVDLVIDGVTFFEGNTVGDGAAIELFDGDLTVTDAEFDGNTASDDGGAVAVVDGVIDFSDTTFTDNLANGDKGGAIYAKFDDLEDVDNYITDSNFVGNASDDFGGAVVVQNDDDDDDDEPVFLYVSGTSFEDNDTDGLGGALRSGHQVMLSIDESTFNGNVSALGDGGAVSAMDDATIGFSVFESNEADDDGGAIYSDEHLYVHDSAFTSNGASYGGAIYAEIQANIQDSVFTNNESTDDGGAAYLDGYLVSTIEGSTFTSNEAAGEGGAIYAEIETAISSSLLNRNSAGDEGGAVFADDVTTITDSRFINNSSVSWAGALSAADTATIENTVFRSNHSRLGGAIDSWGDRLYLKNTQFFGNYASRWGGAIAREVNPEAMTVRGDVDNTTIFRANRSRVGGPVALYRGDDRILAREAAHIWRATGASVYIVRLIKE